MVHTSVAVICQRHKASYPQHACQKGGLKCKGNSPGIVCELVEELACSGNLDAEYYVRQG